MPLMVPHVDGHCSVSELDPLVRLPAIELRLLIIMSHLHITLDKQVMAIVSSATIAAEEQAWLLQRIISRSGSSRRRL